MGAGGVAGGVAGVAVLCLAALLFYRRRSQGDLLPLRVSAPHHQTGLAVAAAAWSGSAHLRMGSDGCNAAHTLRPVQLLVLHVAHIAAG